MKLRGLVSAASLVAVFAWSSHAQAQDNSAQAPQAASQPASLTKAQRKAQRQADRKLARAVREALTHTKGLQTAQINVLSKSGNVSLVGSLPDETQIQLAGEVAQSVPGVVKLTNMLHIREAGH
ncbi:osmotically-inducible protein OsmY [Paraburkholderia tropica]|uniref:BON domain-containing protein n=1 Tax=Paraburkholderia TaxID=1822464 RepID=UPI00161D7C7B|nr:BON domain-containing protein [Paraburkholderia tropica]MBB3000490.1 osmotically-inducible protein OsmY [Paraburkholderia tropica]MBB6320119.1 osmotically-inducible protein OsmY [Paraburkholderia tropica]